MSMPKPREADIQKVCIQWLQAKGFFPIRVNSAGIKVGDRYFRANSQPGCSDVLCCAPDGGFVAIEFKRPKGKPTEQQKQFLGEIVRRNGLALVVSSVDQLEQALRAEGYAV